MTRKLIFTILLGFAFSFSINVKAQDCTPDTLREPGISPEMLPFGQLNEAYSETISVLLFPDTVVIQAGNPVQVKIDSMVMLEVNGLPQGLAYKCKDDNQTFLPMTPSCMSVYGTPTESGVFPLEIPIMTYGKVLGFVPINQGDTIRDYVITVMGGTNQVVKVNPSEINIFPNPAITELSIMCKIEPVVFNAKGQIMELSWVSNRGVFSTNIQHLLPGIYTVISGGKTKRFIKP